MCCVYITKQRVYYQHTPNSMSHEGRENLAKCGKDRQQGSVNLPKGGKVPKEKSDFQITLLTWVTTQGLDQHKT